MYTKLKFLALIFCISSGNILAQSIQVIMSPNPSPYISDWQNRNETVKLAIANPNKKDIAVKIKTELFDGKGALVANTDVSKMHVLIVPPGVSNYNPEDIVPTNAIIYKGNLEKSAIKTGRIPDDNYKLCVTLIDPKNGKPIGTSGTVCKMFTITAYQAPTLINPTNKEVIKGAAIKGIVFRWSPVIPSPKAIVTYRLQVWEVLQGQNSMTAMRNNQHIIEKDLNGILQTQWPIDFPLPDTGITYIWTITPLDDLGRPLVDGLGFSEPFEFRACCWPPPLPPAPDEDEISLISPANGEEISKDVTFSWTDIREAPKEGYTLRIVELKGDQSPEDAIVKNPAVFEQKGIMSKSFKYPDTAPKLEEGETYAWALKGSGGWSKSWVFIWRPNNNLVDATSNFILIIPNPYCPTVDNRPMFKWTYKQKGQKKGKFNYELKIVEMELGDTTLEMFEKRRVVCTISDIKKDSIKYPENKPELESGKVYAWQVKKIENNKITGVSEVIPFFITIQKLPFDVREILCCKNSIVTNGSFEIKNVAGSMGLGGSALSWQKGYGDPIVVSDKDGCNNPGYIRLGGNKNSGSCIKQQLQSPKIQQGKHYRFSACARLSKVKKNTDYFYIKVIAFNNSLPTTGTHPAVSSDISNIGWSGKILQNEWVTFSLNVWTANKNFDNIAIYCLSASGDTMAYCDIDNICFQETKDPRSCDDYEYSETGQPIIDASLTTSMQNVVVTHFTENNGLISDLYGATGNTSLDTWYPLDDDCASIGGTIPSSVLNINYEDSLIKWGIPGGRAKLDRILSITFQDTSAPQILTPVEPINLNCESSFTPDNNLPFGGRDIIFVHGLQLRHLCEKYSGVAGAQKNWPADKSEFYRGGYYKAIADGGWADHINTWLRSKGYKNRVLVVSYNCSQPAIVAAHAVLTQIRDAMDNGQDVEFDSTDSRKRNCFGRNAVIISHSTGGLVIDIAMSLAEKSKYDPILQSQFGNVGFIPDNMKAHVALHGALSGSNMATVYLAVQHNYLSTFLNNQICESFTEASPLMYIITHQSILIDLQPQVAQPIWGPIINTTPVPTITVAGGHPYGVDGAGVLNWALHPGLDDGVVTMSSAIGNPNIEIGAMPSGYLHSPLKSYKIYDMGITYPRANFYYPSQKLFTPSGYAGSSGTPFLSATGMVQPVVAINPSTNPFHRYLNHYSFLQCASDHYIGPRGKSYTEGYIPGNLATSGFVPQCYNYDQSFNQINSEESRCITNPLIYSLGLVSSQVQNMQYERTEGDYIDFDVYGPQFSFKCCPPKIKVWWGVMYHVHIILWERRYHNMVGYECESECSYVYKYLLRN